MKLIFSDHAWDDYEAIELAVDEMKRIQQDLVSEEELETAKNT